MNKNISVYQMNEYEWWASPLNMEKTIEYYEKHVEKMDEEEKEDVEEMDIDKDGLWIEVSEDTKLLTQSNDEFTRTLGDVIEANDYEMGKAKYISYRQEIEKHKAQITKPYCIACTEY